MLAFALGNFEIERDYGLQSKGLLRVSAKPKTHSLCMQAKASVAYSEEIVRDERTT